MLSQRQLFLKHVAQTSPAPMALEIEKAEGVYLTDTNGKKFIDLISGISVSNLGHSNPKVMDAVNRQMHKHAHLMVYGEYIQYPQVKLAEKLVSLLPENLNTVYFTNSGAEATEGAMKLVKRVTGRTQLISFKNSYHGSTQGALSLMGSEEFKTSFRPLLSDILHLDFNELSQLNEISSATAAVFVEAIQAESGVVPAKMEWLHALHKKCKETGTLLVVDEIQTGFGRTGSLFAFEHYNIVPDILLIGKAFGGGLPLAAFVSSQELMNEFTHHPVLGHISTFAGNPVCCAAALASLETLLDADLISQIISKERLLQQFQHTAIREIRCKGLFCAFDFENPELNMRIIGEAVQRGVITDWFLFNAGAMRIAPPLIISEQELSLSLEKIYESIETVI
jgi:acetylornithine/N-succinyldiaminopimelate aminotransferase